MTDSGDGLRLRAATPADLPALERLEALFPGDRLSHRQFRYHLRRGAQLRLAEDADGVAGYALVLVRAGSGGARLYSLVVDPQRRGRGIGAALLADAERGAARLGRDRLRLEVRADNRPAIGLYRARGYVECGRRPGYYDDGETALLLERRLPRSGAPL